jgi:glutamate-5-semialdehyde dehydrogenase
MANLYDIEEAYQSQLTENRIDRLMITEKRLQNMIEGVYQIIQLGDPVGKTLEIFHPSNGLVIKKVSVPFGVIAMIYESRPNVTIDALSLALKTGNAVILRGGKEALRTNMALVAAAKKGLEKTQIPLDAIQLIDKTERESVDILIQAKGMIDLVIPRGGAGLIQRVIQNSLVPVIETGVGNCHLYIDESADLNKATQISINAKVQRPSVCNAIETLLVHQNLTETWLPEIIKAFYEHGVEIRGCPKTVKSVKDLQVIEATEEDYATEFLDQILPIKVVNSVEEAIAHIKTYGTSHSEAIVTENTKIADQFLAQVDASTVYHNASTRFTDGFEFGFGAEIGISTQKLHARGPMGLKELTSYKYVIKGTGQVRT